MTYFLIIDDTNNRMNARRIHGHISDIRTIDEARYVDTGADEYTSCLGKQKLGIVIDHSEEAVILSDKEMTLIAGYNLVRENRQLTAQRNDLLKQVKELESRLARAKEVAADIINGKEYVEDTGEPDYD